MDKSTFSFYEFYTRRIKRIFPALILVLFFCISIGWLGLLSDEFKQLGKYIASSAGFSTNFILLSEAGYFDSSAETKPLLHLWSLGIEEQFYILWPFFAWFASKQKLNMLTLTVIMGIMSFILNYYYISKDPILTFYSPQTRFWELLCGSILAWTSLNKKVYSAELKYSLFKFQLTQLISKSELLNNKYNLNTSSILGGILLLYGFFKIDNEAIYPGAWALIPVSGALLLIASGSEAWINRTILSNKVIVWFGLISFPLYLWHWPLLCFARLVEGSTPSREIRIGCIALSIILAWFTYIFIEKPIRHNNLDKIKLMTCTLLMTFLGASGYAIYKYDGLSFRKNAMFNKRYEGDIGHSEYFKFTAEKYFTCMPDKIAKESLKWANYTRCFQSKKTSKLDIALVGDSHAEHLFLGMSEALPDKNIVYYIRNSSPFISNPDFKEVFKTIVDSKTITSVILTQHWIGRFSSVPNDSTLELELTKVIDNLSKSGKQVYLTDDIPSFPNEPILCKGSRWPRSKNKTLCEIGISDVDKQRNVYRTSLNNVVKARPNVKIIKIGQYLCNANGCSMVIGREILYRDSNHLNVIGSRYVGKRLVKDNPDIFDN